MPERGYEMRSGNFVLGGRCAREKFFKINEPRLN